jgi:hypothetical protein
MSISELDAKLIGDIALALDEKIRALQDRVKELEARQPVINNYYSYPSQPVVYPPNVPQPFYPTWTCKNDTNNPSAGI